MECVTQLLRLHGLLQPSLQSQHSSMRTLSCCFYYVHMHTCGCIYVYVHIYGWYVYRYIYILKYMWHGTVIYVSLSISIIMITTHDHNHNRIRNDTHHPSLPVQLQFVSNTGLDLHTWHSDASHTILGRNQSTQKKQQSRSPNRSPELLSPQSLTLNPQP